MVKLLKAIIVMMTYCLHRHFHELRPGAQQIDAQFYYQIVGSMATAALCVS